MKNRAKKIISVLAIIFLVLIILLAIFTGWFYLSPPTGFKEKIAETLPYPAALVDGRPILLREVIQRQAIASSTPGAILDEIVAEQQTDIVAERYGVSVSDTQLNAQMGLLEQQPGFAGLLLSYGLSEDNFKNSVLKPQLLYTNIELWYNSQQSLNPAAYQVADAIKQDMVKNAATGTFASLVQTYSRDSSTKALDGNLGFVEINSLRPEFQGAVESAEAGSVVVAPGQDGLYIFQIQSRDNAGPGNSPRAELAEIYLPTTGFQDWYNNEIKNINIKKLI